MIHRIRAALADFRPNLRDENALHRQIMECFDRAGIDYENEARLNSRDRIDFIVNGCIAIEVKRGGGNSGLAPWRQLFRYLEDPRFDMGILITTGHTQQPLSHFERADGTLIPLHKIELWKNLL